MRVENESSKQMIWVDDNNKALITDDMKAKLEAARADIVSGKVQVHDYMSDSACPN